MNKKAMVLIVFGIALLAVVVVIVVNWTNKSGQSGQQSKNEQTNDMVKLSTQKKGVQITYDGNIFTPAQITTETGTYLLVANVTKVDVVIGMTGAINSQFSVKAGGTAMSPIITQGGVIKIFDIKKSSNSGTIKVTGVSNTTASGEQGLKDVTNVVAKNGVYKEIEINGNGFSPATVTLNKNELLHFINKTNKDVEIASSGKLSVVVASIPAGKTGISLPLGQSGTYSFSLKSNPSVKGTVTVK